MGWTSRLLLLSLLGLAACQQRSIGSDSRRLRNRVVAGKSEVIDFNCPEDFGYYPHPSDCTQYYVCVFGGALQESCTGGLMYSNELQTCDWPRNVICTLSSKGVSTVRITDPRTSASSPIRPATEALTPSVGSSSFSFSGVHSQDSQATDLSPVRIFQGGRDRDARLISSSSPSQQSLAKQTSTRGSQFPETKALQGSNIHSVFQTNNPSAFQAPERPKPTPAPVPTRTPRPSARPTSRPTSRPSPALTFDDAFYPGLNFTDADYYYYYDDLLYDYYDTDFTASSTPAPSRRPSTTARPVSRGTPPSRRTPPAQSASGPATTDNSIPSRPAALYPQPPVDSVATKCDPKVCRLPDCYCGGAAVPGGFAPENIPQLVLLTFDDAVNDLNKGLYKDLFEVGRKNPNGCPIQSTMYVSHEWTDYSHVQNLYADGHEMASHSVSHSFGEQFSVKKWSKEVAGQREILAAYGGVKMEDVRGMRAPFLAIGGNNMFKMLYDQNFTYDSSMPVYENNPPSWPYTLDYKVFHDCMIPPCPTKSYPGVWQVPMVMWQDLNGGRCSMGDACTTPPDAEGVYKMLIKNFERHYTTNRAPFGLYYHAAWFTTPHHKEGFIAFLDTITAMDDVWLTTNWQALQYVRDSVPLSQVKNYKPFQCNYPDRPPRCDRPKVCNVWHKGGVRYMRTCQKCPEKYPWTGNTGVRSPLNDL